jgi:cytochrome c oxidase subunit 3
VTADSRALATADHGALAEAAHEGRGISIPILGMLLFISSEVMFFAGLFAAYFSTRANFVDANGVKQWPPEQFGEILKLKFEPIPLIVVATAILILSSVTCQMAVWAIRRDDRRGFLRALGVTFLLGVSFLVMQGIDYSMLFGEGMTMGSGPFGTTYFTLTGFHGAHVFGGVIMLGVVLYRGMAGQFSARHHDALEAASLYWHFVDVVWILLFSILYLL